MVLVLRLGLGLAPGAALDPKNIGKVKRPHKVKERPSSC